MSVTTKAQFSFFTEIRPAPASRLSAGLFRFLPPATRAELLGGAAMIVISLLLAAWALKCRSDALALEGDSVMVEGKVLRLWVTHGKGLHHHVAYEYPATPDAGARLLQSEEQIPEKAFDRLKVGGPVAVKVCRSDPANHLVAGARPRAFSDPLALPFVLGILAMLALAGAINLWWWWFCRRRPSASRIFILGGTSIQSTSL
jgi:hypothetical protein